MKTSDELKIVHVGATPSELGKMFGMSPQEINNRLVGKVIPNKTEHKTPRYLIAEAAPYLCNVEFDIEEYLKGMSPAKMPPALQKAFWSALNARQDYEENRGDLWRTQRVVEVLGEVFKNISMTAQMFEDTVSQETELTAKQREIIIKLSEGLRGTMHQSLVARFKNYRPAEDEHGVQPDLKSTITIDEDAEYDDGLD